MMMKTKTLWVRQIETESSGNAFDWWNEVDASEEWQRGVYLALCAAYALVSLVALRQLLRIQMIVPNYGWTTQKVFHLMNFLVNGLRTILFGLYKNVLLLKPKVFEMMLLDLPKLLFFTTYTLLVLFWAVIYYQARSLCTKKVIPTYYIINGFIYFTQACIWIYIRLSSSSAAVEVGKVFLSVFSFSAALGFLIYGGRLFVMLGRFPSNQWVTKKSCTRIQQFHIPMPLCISHNWVAEHALVGFVTGTCCTCFLIRCIMVAISAFDKNAELDVPDHPILNLFYCMLVKILPSALVLFILRKLPPRRVSDQYHPIQ